MTAAFHCSWKLLISKKPHISSPVPSPYCLLNLEVHHPMPAFPAYLPQEDVLGSPNDKAWQDEEARAQGKHEW